MEKMNLDFGISHAVTIVVISIIFILLWVSFDTAKKIGSSRYWALVWIPMGWLISLPLTELISQTIFQSEQSIVAGWNTPHIILWSIAFIVLLIGFLPQFRPKNRVDRINLLIFIIVWTITMAMINLFWFMLIFS
jgi:hypothetical protein